MRILKPLFFATASALILASCGSSVAPLTSTPIGNIDSQPLKIGDISDDQLKSWSYTDLVTDTIPGMSVNKAYAELIPTLGEGT
ncbi:MAG: peptidase S8, partial [Flavobacteriaceae bacterium]